MSNSARYDIMSVVLESAAFTTREKETLLSEFAEKWIDKDESTVNVLKSRLDTIFTAIRVLDTIWENIFRLKEVADATKDAELQCLNTNILTSLVKITSKSEILTRMLTEITTIQKETTQLKARTVLIRTLQEKI